ncbi:MAG TPA: hypothetical protein VG826_18055 [Pirellulales bacterium]|nr:hypothetical protein [Pirellulales bacterium]
MLLDAAVAGGWKPERALAEYSTHQGIVSAREASAIADGLENAFRLLNEHPHNAGELERFRLLTANPDHMAQAVEFFRLGDFQIDDYTKEGRVAPFMRDLPI